MKDETFDQLVFGFFDNELSGAQFEALQETLSQSAEARRRYRELAEMNGLLGIWGAQSSRRQQERPAHSPEKNREAQIYENQCPVGKEMIGTETVPNAAGTAALPKKHRLPLIGLAAAAVLMVGAILLWMMKIQQPILTFRIPGAPMSSPASLAKGEHLRLDAQGVAELKFSSGVTGFVRGPADLTLISKNEIRLDEGRARFNVPHSAAGFTVTAKGLQAVDLGTEFGVLEISGREEVHVFTGKVKVIPIGGNAQELTAGMARRRAANSAGLTAMKANPALFFLPAENPTQSANPRAPLRRFGSLPFQEAAEENRKAFQFNRKGMKVEPWVEEMRALRGSSLTAEEREVSLAFLSGKDWPEELGMSSCHWLADELLTVLRLQNPAQEDLAAKLAEIASRPETDPVVRDYITRHLGLLWEQFGARKEIEEALWRAVDSPDEAEPGTALIALSTGYARDNQAEKLERVRTKALELAENAHRPLAVRVTALGLAGEGGGERAKKLAKRLGDDPKTPLMLRRVAEHVLKAKK